MAGPDPQAIADRARAAGRIGIDTEFMGEGRYRPLLCLVQVVTEHAPGSQDVEVEILDPLADGGFDAQPLADVLADPAVEIIFHAGRQDVGILRRVWQTPLTNVFDTQIAAGFAGLRAQMGYEGLLSELLRVRLRKSASFTRWDARPLTAEQVDYAREDVLHLLQATDALRERLSGSGRLEWAQEECRALEGITDERDIDTIFERLPRIGGLEPSVRAVARELVVWREDTARAGDRPVSSVLQDAVLVEVAKRRPRNPDKLREIRGLHEGIVRRHGKAILAAVERGREAPPIPAERERTAPSKPEDAPLIALCEALVRTRAMEADLAYELLAARADLQQIVTAVRTNAPDAEVRTMQGWRRELVGGELVELLEGRHALRVGPRRRISVEPASE